MVITDLNIASPKIFRHYILDIPKVSDKHIINAVRFELKSLYPGTEENTLYDFKIFGNKIIGVAASKSSVFSVNQKLISNSFLILNSFKNGQIVTISNNWVEFICIQNGVPLCIKTFSINSLENFNSIESEFSDNYNLPKSVFFLDSKIPTDLKEYLSNNYHINNYERLLMKKNVKKSEIFNLLEKKSKRNFLTILTISIIAVLGIFETILFFKSKKIENQAASIKNEYISKRNDFGITIDSSETKNISTELFYTLISNISCSSNSIRLISFDYDVTAFRLEADKANAISVLNELSKDNLFKSLEIQQATPQEDGYEHFIIKGMINHDKK